ncbi:hypothetical protein GWI33_014313 [Rhynchophorus ferrugineus]|uniref:Cyclic nucleotide-binding domain-containing protein n=1 Tax=Rhynchophorus ferrugineus TaxID=354439 RepID=A0A834MAS7_RHYFE|nr:hypothetical protein GWI33_014313 [Rhynchophorus ferrugineus]
MSTEKRSLCFKSDDIQTLKRVPHELIPRDAFPKEYPKCPPLTCNPKPCDRNVKDVELICSRLRRVDQFCRLPNSLLQQLALCGYYEDLENGVTLFRQGDTGKCWYAVMSGTLEVRVAQPETDPKVV